MFYRLSHSLLLPILLALPACALQNDDMNAGLEADEGLVEHSSSGELPDELAFECPRPCILTPAAPPSDEELVARALDKKLASLDDWTRGWVMANPVGDLVKLEGKRGYRRYEGFFGPAIIFTDYFSTYISYGVLLETWEQRFGFGASPLGDPYDDQGAVRQDFNYVTWSETINPCFQDATAYISWAEGRAVKVFTEVRYYNSYDPDHPYLSPPEYSQYQGTPVSNIFDEPPSNYLWCGPPHPSWSDPSWQDPSEEFDPTTI